MSEEKKKAKAKADDGSVQVSLRVSPEAMKKLEAERAQIAKQFGGLKVPLAAVVGKHLHNSLGLTE